jgi:hypothetical protein
MNNPCVVCHKDIEEGEDNASCLPVGCGGSFHVGSCGEWAICGCCAGCYDCFPKEDENDNLDEKRNI